MSAPSTRRVGPEVGVGQQPVHQGPAALLAAIQMVAPDLARRAAEIEATGALPTDLFERLRNTGLFKMLTPRALGGGEFALPDIIPIIEEIARADGSTGWSVMVAAECAAIWLHFDEQILVRDFDFEQGVLTRAPLSPKGRAERVEGGFRVSGKWPLASGSYVADRFLVCAAVIDSGRPTQRSDGLPDFRVFAVPPGAVRELKTWDAIGMRSTNSHDVEIKDVFVPEEHVIPFLIPPEGKWQIQRVPIWLAMGPFHCAVILGIASGGMDDLVALLPTKRPLFNPSIKSSQDGLIQYRVGAAQLRLSAARSFVVSETEKVWKLAQSGEASSPLVRAHFRAMMAHIHAECMVVMNEIFNLAGSSVLYNGSPLQRRFRDMRAACQHVIADTAMYSALGSLMMGEVPRHVAAL